MPVGGTSYSRSAAINQLILGPDLDKEPEARTTSGRRQSTALFSNKLFVTFLNTVQKHVLLISTTRGPTTIVPQDCLVSKSEPDYWYRLKVLDFV